MIAVVNNYFLTKKRVKKEYMKKKNDSSGKKSDPGNFLKSGFVIFSCQKYVKKGRWK